MEEEFAEFLADVLCGQRLITWRLRSANFVTTPLKQGFDSYRWKGRDYRETKCQLDGLQADLRDAMAATEEQGLRNVVARILKWGGVYRPNRKWFESLGSDAELRSSLDSVVFHIRQRRFDAAGFELDQLRSNAGLTKVYSLAWPGFVIYDSRVAAALQVLVGMFLAQRNEPAVPPTLAFPGMPTTATRAIRQAAYRGQAFPNTKNSSSVHMGANLLANRVLRRAIELARGRGGGEWCCNQADGLRRVEAALFMVGYDLPCGLRAVRPNSSRTAA